MTIETDTPILIAGCGQVGKRLALLLRKDNRINALVRTPGSQQACAELGLDAFACDLDQAEALPCATLGSTIFYLAPPPKKGEQDLRLRHFLRLLEHSGQPQQIIYLGTTGVYGDGHGDWVDETRTPAPQAARALRRWDAENALLEWREQSGGQLVRLRVAGIYGEGKLPLERLQRGEPLIEREHSPWTNRIHIDDLVQALLAARTRGRDGEVYNLSDGQPLRMTDYFLAIAEAAGIPAPPLLPPGQAALVLSEGMQSYLAESRRIDNRKMLTELGIQLMYPTLDVALRGIFRSDRPE